MGKRVRTRVLPWALLALGACAGDGITSPPDPELLDAPPTVRVGSVDLSLEAGLWRDFQPGGPRDGRGLAAVVRVKVDPLSSYRPDVRIESLHVVFGEEVWSSEPEAVPQPGGIGVLVEGVSRGGPRWGPGVLVDVVARLGTPEGVRLLKAAAVPIQRAD